MVLSSRPFHIFRIFPLQVFSTPFKNEFFPFSYYSPQRAQRAQRDFYLACGRLTHPLSIRGPKFELLDISSFTFALCQLASGCLCIFRVQRLRIHQSGLPTPSANLHIFSTAISCTPSQVPNFTTSILLPSALRHAPWAYLLSNCLTILPSKLHSCTSSNLHTLASSHRLSFNAFPSL